MKKNLILASSSPRRRELLGLLRVPFTIVPSVYEEDASGADGPHELVRRLALGKALDVAARARNAVVIGADTIVVLGKTVLGKPKSATHAREMLRKLSGKAHSVITGFSVIDTESGKRMVCVSETKVYFRKLAPREIAAYVATGEPFDKAGAYAIQGFASVFVEKIAGDYFTIVGLPVSALAQALKKFGVSAL